MDWQTNIAIGIALLAALWAGKLLLLPWVREFQKKDSAGGCGGCGGKSSLCITPEKPAEKQ